MGVGRKGREGDATEDAGLVTGNKELETVASKDVPFMCLTPDD